MLLQIVSKSVTCSVTKSRRFGRLFVSLLILALLWLVGMEPAHAQLYGLDERPLVGAFLNGAFPAAEAVPTGWQAVVAFPGLTFDDPISLTPQPGTSRLYVSERQGAIYFFENNPATTNKTLFLDLTSKTQGYNDCGVLGFAFHPQFGQPTSTNRGYVYVYYSYSPEPVGPSEVDIFYTRSYNRLSRFTVPDGSQVADPGSELVLINQYDEQLWHNGGGMFFGADGFLYLSNGDEGWSEDQLDNSQKMDSGLFSGVLRIDVDRDPSRSHPIRRQPENGNLWGPLPSGWPNSFTANYFVPNDNPWLNTNGTILEEFYAIGLRSPHRMTYDSVSNQIWLGDVGQELWEEVDIIEAGGNYQWSYKEGTHAGFKSKPNPLIGLDKPPIYEYPHKVGNQPTGNNCVIGGYMYRGSQHPTLYGKYIFGDNGSGRVWAMTYDGVNPATVTQLCTMPAVGYGLASFGVDQDNELLMTVAGGETQIYKLSAITSPSAQPPALLSQTGAFTNLATLAPAAALIPFDVNTPLWSDNAAKLRWLVVPNNGAPYGTNETISYSSNGIWTFPVGTVLVKHFDLPVDDTNPAVLKRMETRFLVHATNDTWYGLTYKWRADNTDADLLPGSLNETLFIPTSTGNRTQVWYYPSRQDCRSCHTANAGHALGPKTGQFNRSVFYPATGREDNQLRALNHIGIFNTNLSEANIPDLPQFASVTDTAFSLEQRVRSYLDANCAHCHRPGGVKGLFDARFSTPLQNQGLVGGAVADTLGIAGAKVIKHHSPAQSILYVRDSALGAIQMPPLAKNMVDTNYINVLGQWINSLNQTPVTAPDLVTRWMSQGVGTPVVNLLTNDFDPDGDGLSLVEVSGSAPAGASLSYSNDWVTYWPPFGNTNAGNFSYIISDGHGGSATGLVNVAVIPDPAGVDVLGIALGTLPAVDVILTGIPGFTYTVQYSDGLQPAVWQNLTNATADGSGTLRILDSHSSVTNRFYRAVRGLAP